MGTSLSAAALATPGSGGNQVPNIMLLIADDAGWNDFGCYGNPSIRTPHIDRMAEQGVRFTNAFVTAPQCSPSRASIWTGKYAHSTGTEDLHSPLPEDEQILPDLLQSEHYYSGNVGKLHLGKAVRSQFDYYSRDVENWEKFLRNRPANRPFLLGIGFHEPHRPYLREKFRTGYAAEETLVPVYLPSVLQVQKDLARYYTEISRMDRRIGKLMAYLESENLTEKTLVIFFSDHGLPFPRAKGFLYDPGIRTPLIMQWQGTMEPGIRRGLTSLIDLAPTLLDLVGLDIPTDLQGQSFLPQLMDETAAGRSRIYSERNWHDLDDHIRSVRTPRYKYIRNYYPWEPYTLPADVYGSPTFKAMRKLRKAGELTEVERQIFLWPRPEEELYDLDNDPNEFHNLVGEAAYQEVLTRLRADAGSWENRTHDVSPAKRKPNRYDYWKHVEIS